MLSGMRLVLVLGLLCCAAMPARAAEVTARYAVHGLGLTVMRIEARIALDERGYRVRLASQTVGLARQLVSGAQQTVSEGRWQGMHPLPLRYRMENSWRGTHRTASLDWPVPGGPPVLAVHPQEDEDEREPVPAEQQAGTMDGLSTLAFLSRMIQQDRACDGAAAAYDGRRRTEYRVHTAGWNRLEPGGEPAVRCELEIRTVAGFRRDADREAEMRPRTGTVWMGTPFAGFPPVPLRIEVPSRWFGTVRVVLEGVAPSAPAGE